MVESELHAMPGCSVGPGGSVELPGGPMITPDRTGWQDLHSGCRGENKLRQDKT